MKEMHVCYGTLNRADTFHWPSVHGLLQMDYRNGLPELTAINGLPKWTTLNYLPWKKKKITKVTKAWLFWSTIVKTVSTKDLVSNSQVQGVKNLLIRQRCKRSSILIQFFTSFRLLRSAKFLLATQGIGHHKGRMNAPVEQLTSSIKKELSPLR